MPAKREDTTSPQRQRQLRRSRSSAAASSASPSPGAPAQRGLSVRRARARRARRGHLARGRRACSRRSPRPTPASGRCSSSGCAARERWPAFAAQLGRGQRHRRRLPHVRHADARARSRRGRGARARARRCASASGCASSALLPSAARRLEPALAPTLRSALHLPDDHAVDPRLVCAALARAARARRRRCCAPASRSPTSPRCRPSRSWSPPGRGRAPSATRRACARSRASRCACATRPAPACWSASCAGASPAPATSCRAATGATCSARPQEERGFDTAVTAGGVHELLRDAAELVPGVLELEVEEAHRRPASRHARQRPDHRPLAARPAGRVGHRALPQRRAAGARHRRPRGRRAGGRAGRARLRARALRGRPAEALA